MAAMGTVTGVATGTEQTLRTLDGGLDSQRIQPFTFGTPCMNDILEV